MKKNTNLCIDLKTVMQQDTVLNQKRIYRGVLSRTGENQYLFEEAVAAARHPLRNPKLFEGKYVSFVHMQNGRYQAHLRTIDVTSCPDRRQLAFNVYAELLKAFEIID